MIGKTEAPEAYIDTFKYFYDIGDVQTFYTLLQCHLICFPQKDRVKEKMRILQLVGVEEV